MQDGTPIWRPESVSENEGKWSYLIDSKRIETVISRWWIFKKRLPSQSSV
jgi:hypothetical protein